MVQYYTLARMCLLSRAWALTSFIGFNPYFPRQYCAPPPANALIQKRNEGRRPSRSSSIVEQCPIRRASASRAAAAARLGENKEAAATTVPLLTPSRATGLLPAEGGTPSTIAILTSILGDLTARQLRLIVDSPAYREIELKLRKCQTGAGDDDDAGNHVDMQLRELLEAVLEVVGGGDERACAVKVVVECPALLLWDAHELRARMHELQNAEGISNEQATQLMIEFPSFATLPRAERDEIAFFLGEAGLTGKEVGRLAKRYPDAMRHGANGGARRLTDYFLEDLKLDKAALRKMVARQPSLLALSLTGDVMKKTEFFTREMGLGSDQIAKMLSSHPQVLHLNLEKSIRPIVRWLGTPDPEAKQNLVRVSTGDSVAVSTGVSRLLTAASSTDSERNRGTDNHGGVARTAAAAAGEDRVSPSAVVPGGDVNGLIPRFPVEERAEGRGVGVSAELELELELAGDEEGDLLEMPTMDADGEWGWGLGLDAEGRRQVVSKQGDVLWKSVPGNLAKSTAWFVQEVGLSWQEMRKLAARTPAILSLSVENNLQTTLGFLVKELGMDPAKVKRTIVNQSTLLTLSVPGNLRPKAALFRDELGANESDIAELLNQCPRVMNASVQGRILPRIQAMRAAGFPPAFPHLRIICNYTEARFADWIARVVGQQQQQQQQRQQRSHPVTAPPDRTTTTTTTTTAGAAADANPTTMPLLPTAITPLLPTAIPRGRPLSGASYAPRPSVRTDSLSELGISYAVSSSSSSSSSRSRSSSRLQQRSGDKEREERRGTLDSSSGGRRGERVGGGIGADGGGGKKVKKTQVSSQAAVETREAFAPGRTGSKALVRKVSRGLEVLDLFCGTGGFALNAAAGGALSALGVDKAVRAVRTSRKNAVANGLEGTASFVRAGVVAFAEEAASEGKSWDLVVVDPPSFLPKSRSTKRASNTYTRMAEKVSRIVRSGGMLMIVDDRSGGEVFDTPEALVGAFSTAAMRAAGLSLTLLGAGGGGGSDSVQVPGRHVRRGDSRSGSGGGGGDVVTTVGKTMKDVGKAVSGGSGDVGVRRGGGGVGGGGTAGATGAEEVVVRWALFVCSKAPS